MFKVTNLIDLHIQQMIIKIALTVNTCFLIFKLMKNMDSLPMVCRVKDLKNIRINQIFSHNIFFALYCMILAATKKWDWSMHKVCFFQDLLRWLLENWRLCLYNEGYIDISAFFLIISLEINIVYYIEIYEMFHERILQVKKYIWPTKTQLFSQ